SPDDLRGPGRRDVRGHRAALPRRVGRRARRPGRRRRAHAGGRRAHPSRRAVRPHRITRERGRHLRPSRRPGRRRRTRRRPAGRVVLTLVTLSALETWTAGSEAGRLVTEASLLAQTLDLPPSTLASTLINHGIYLAVTGRPTEAAAYHREAARLAEQHDPLE